MAVALDVTNPDQIAATVRAAEARFGAVDVLVNNAGYGYFGAIKEGEDADVRARHRQVGGLLVRCGPSSWIR